MVFCSLFNSGSYAVEGWVCHYTLYQLDNNVKFYLLCMDNNVFKHAQSLKRYGVIPIHFSQLEKEYPQLLKAKQDRSFKEYIVTFKPFLPEYIFKKYNEEKIIFTDSDIAFWNNPYEMFNELDEHSFFAKDHEIEPQRLAGRFNVGLLGFKNDKNCNEWLKWWQSKCIEWCKWFAHEGKFAEQGYLNILHDNPNMFKGFLSTKHPGINLAPWNIMKHKLSMENGKIKVDGENLICYHYHEFEILDSGGYKPTGWKLPPNAKNLLYDPYFKLVKMSQKNQLWGK